MWHSTSQSGPCRLSQEQQKGQEVLIEVIREDDDNGDGKERSSEERNGNAGTRSRPAAGPQNACESVLSC
jgi:hypothetical protein